MTTILAAILAVFLNSRGDIAAGVGGGYASYNGTVVATPAGGTVFVDDDHLVYQHCEGPGCWIEGYDVRTGQTSVVSERSASSLSGGGGRWASFGPYGVYFSDTGLTLAEAGLGPAGPDGAVAVKDRYQGCCGWSVYETSGLSWRLTEGDAYDIVLAGQGRALWHEQGVLHVRGLPEPQVLAGAVWWPHAALLDGQWWLLYQTEQGGRLVLHPFDNYRQGYVVSPGPLTYRPDMVQIAPGVVKVAWAVLEGEAPGEILSRIIDLSAPREELVPPVPPEIVLPPDNQNPPADVRDARIAFLAAENERLTAQVADQDRRLSEKDIQIADIQRQLDALLARPAPRCEVQRSQLMRIFGINPACRVVE